MVEPAIMITNNSMVREKLCDRFEMIFIDGTLLDVLKAVRDCVHKGHKLLTHPLSGSIKPNETPFKSVLISKAIGKTIDMDSLTLIENGMHTAEKLLKTRKTPDWPSRLLEDFKLIDFDLIQNAIN